MDDDLYETLRHVFGMVVQLEFKVKTVADRGTHIVFVEFSHCTK